MAGKRIDRIFMSASKHTIFINLDGTLANTEQAEAAYQERQRRFDDARLVAPKTLRLSREGKRRRGWKKRGWMGNGTKSSSLAIDDAKDKEVIE